MTIAVGDKLRNGATVLAVRSNPARYTIVAAHWVCSSTSHAYVTWAVDDNKDTYWGHYFKTEAEAHADLDKRSEH